MASKLKGQISYILLNGVDDLEVDVYYSIIPGNTGIMFGNCGDTGSSPEYPDIDIIILNDQEQEVNVDERTANKIIELCFKHAKDKNYR